MDIMAAKMPQLGILTELILLSLMPCMHFVDSGALLGNAVKAPHFVSQSLSLPSIEVYEVQREGVDSVNNDIKVGPEDSSVLQMVNISRNSDLLFGEVTGSDSALLLHCHAPYSVQWIFRGDSDPEFNTNTTTKMDSNGDISYSAYLFLGSRRILNERETGKYICTSVRNKRLNSYVYLFVTKSALFTNKGLETIYYSDRDAFVRIPCSLSEPRATTAIQKSQDGVLKCPMNDSVRFDSKQGFIMNPKKLQQPEGTYLCIADYNNTFQIIKYNVMRDGGVNNESISEQTSDEFEDSPTEPSEFHPTQSPSPPTQQSTPPQINDPPPESNTECVKKACGENAYCLINSKGDAVCRCKKGYSGNPYVKCKHKSQLSTTSTVSPPPQHSESTTYLPPSSSTSNSESSHEYSCDSYEDCPNDRTCIQQVCQDPCTVNSICGPNANCETQYHTPFCKCNSGYEGDPYSSQPGQKCEKSHCDPNPCGPNSICKYINGIISCSCEPGYAITSDGVCRPNQKKNSSAPEQLVESANLTPRPFTRNVTSTLPPGKQCRFDTDCPDSQMCIQDACENPCVNACGAGATCHTRNHFPRCLCPEGTTGDPFYKCTPLFSEVLGSSTTSVSPPPPPLAINSQHDNGSINCGGRNSPCGPNTICQASRNQFVCVCPNDFSGDPYSSQGCTRKRGYLKCGQDSDCPYFLACLRHQGCVNPCNIANVCQEERSCVPFNHRPACLRTDNFNVELPRDGLATEKEIVADELEISEIPVGSGCFIKEDGRIASPCGKNSVCYDKRSLIANGLGGIFCGCMENHTGDPYEQCEPIRHCTSANSSACNETEACLNGICTEQIPPNNSTFKSDNTSAISGKSGNPCSPSPCSNAGEICMITRSNNAAKCIPPSEFNLKSSQTSVSLSRSDACQLSGTCEEGENDEAQTQASYGNAAITEIPQYFTVLPTETESTNAGLSSDENQGHYFDTVSYSMENGQYLPNSGEEETVVDA